MSQPKKTLLETATEIERAKREARRIVDAEDAPKHPPLQALTVPQLLASPAPDYLIDLLLPVGALAEFVGDSESLKSFFAIHLGMAIASGQSNFFELRVMKQGAVLYIAAEGSGAFQFRLRAWGTEHDVDITTVPFWTIAAPVNLRDVNFQEELRQIVRDKCPVLIVVDTLHRCIPGAEENSSRDLGEVVGFATRLQAESGAAVLFLHHPPKNDPSGRGRGSGALYYAADTELSAVLEGEEQSDGTKVINVSVKKQKDDSKVSLTLTNRIVPVLDRDGRPMAYASGRPITSCVLTLASPEDIEAATQAKADTLTQQIVGFVRAHPGSTKTEIRAGVKAQMRTVSEAVEALLQDGRLTKENVKQGKTRRDEYRESPQMPLPQTVEM